MKNLKGRRQHEVTRAREKYYNLEIKGKTGKQNQNKMSKKKRKNWDFSEKRVGKKQTRMGAPT